MSRMTRLQNTFFSCHQQLYNLYQSQCECPCGQSLSRICSLFTYTLSDKPVWACMLISSLLLQAELTITSFKGSPLTGMSPSSEYKWFFICNIYQIGPQTATYESSLILCSTSWTPRKLNFLSAAPSLPNIVPDHWSLLIHCSIIIQLARL